MKTSSIACLSALTLLSFALSGCSGPAGPSYVNPGIAGNYLEFYEAGPSDPTKAKSAVEKAISADPENAYSHYLAASVQAQAGNLDEALATLEKANQLKKTTIYVSAPPPEDPMQSLTRIRQLGFSTDKAGSLGDRQPEYIQAVRTMGERVARAEPTASLAVLNGTGVIRKTYQSEIAYWQSQKNAAKQAEAEEKLTAFAKWYEGMNKALSETLADIMTTAATAAKLSKEEAEQYAKGMTLKDSGKQAKADEAKRKVYEAEIAALKKALGTMPKV